MRREGFELTVGQPQVVTREIDGKVHEPVERMTIDVPEDYVGVVTQLLALRKGRMEQMVNHGTGWVRMDYLVPARGLIGFRTEFLTETRGTGIAPPRLRRATSRGTASIRTRPTGALVADRSRRRRPASPAVQPAGARHAVRRARRRGLRGHDRRRELPRRRPRRQRRAREAPDQHALGSTPTCSSASCRPSASLDQALEFLREDECVEVTPEAVRLRKTELAATAAREGRQAAKAGRATQPV